MQNACNVTRVATHINPDSHPVLTEGHFDCARLFTYAEWLRSPGIFSVYDRQLLRGNHLHRHEILTSNGKNFQKCEFGRTSCSTITV